MTKFETPTTNTPLSSELLLRFKPQPQEPPEALHVGDEATLQAMRIKRLGSLICPSEMET
jgi:hypothetical protein